MKFYIINLAIHKERRELMQRRCEELKIDYEFIDAVYGKSLSADELARLTYDKVEQLKRFKRELSLGEIGCALSHKKCLEALISSGDECCVVLEDDAIFDEKLPQFLSHLDEFPKDLELLLLGHYRQFYYDDGYMIKSPLKFANRIKIADNYICRLAASGNGTHAYFVTKKGAARLLLQMQKIAFPSDHYTPNSDFVNVYALKNTLADPDLCEVSSTQVNAKNKKKSKISKHFKRLKFFLQFLPRQILPAKKYHINQ